MTGESDPKGAELAGLVARTLLLLYPPSFRRELVASLLEDVGRRAQDLRTAGASTEMRLWLVRLAFSFLMNAPGAWFETLLPNGRRARRRRARWARLAGSQPTTLDVGSKAHGSRFSLLDLKLGLRMLLKYPGLTLAGGFGIAVAIGASVGCFAFAYSYFYPDIPLDEGHRLVGLENWDMERNNEERRSLHDFVIWREEMRSVEDMSAFRTVSRNLGTGEGTAELIRVAEITPSGFDLARVPPFMGRTLVAADAEPGAADVLVIAYGVWRARFGADPDIVGRDVRLGRVVHTIVGVMPEGFAFPVSHHYWIPFRENPTDYPMGEGPSIFISGRLAPGSTLADAKSELTVIGERMAAEYPDTHERFRAQVMPYVYPLVDVNQGAGEDILPSFLAMNGFISLLLVLVGLNVAVLVYARTATRRGEIAVRTALGAGRTRIVGQLFAESLVLSVVAAAVGLVLARGGMELGNRIMAMEVAETPFWLDLGVPAPAVVYTVALTILAAAITGIIPGLQATGKRVHENIRQYGSGVGLRLGRTWTTLIVLQVLATVAGLPLAVAMGWGEVSFASTVPAYPVEEFLAVFTASDLQGMTDEELEELRATQGSYFGEIRSELMRRTAEEPGVVALTPIAGYPGLGSRVRIMVESEVGGPGSGDSYEVRSSTVHSDFFPVFELPVEAGRPILPGDLEEGVPDVVVVDRTFVNRILGGGDAVGRRLRLVTPGIATPEGEERWYEIVGVSDDMHRNLFDQGLVEPHVYRALREPPYGSAGFVVRVAGIEPTSIVTSIRANLTELDPTMRLTTRTLEDVYRQERLALLLVAFILALIAASVLLLSSAGIYALMSFTVSQRRREIGIRTALGAPPRRLLGGIFARALVQLGFGLVLGVTVVVITDWSTGGEALQGYGSVLITSMVIVMTVVGLLAALGPARRGLGVAPAEALQAE